MAHPHSMSFLQDDSSSSSSDDDSDGGSQLVLDIGGRASAVPSAAGRRSPSVSFHTAMQNIDDASDLFQWEQTNTGTTGDAPVAAAPAAANPAAASAVAPLARAPAVADPSSTPAVLSGVVRRVAFRAQQLTGDEIRLLLHEALFNPAHVPTAFRAHAPQSVPVELDIAHNQIDSLDCIQALLESGVQLHSLQASHNDIVHIERAFTLCPSLVELDLSCNALTSLRASGLAVCTQLQRVSLHSNCLRDVDELLRHPSITHLDITRNDMSADDGESLLYALSSMPALTSLNVTEGNAPFRTARGTANGGQQMSRARILQSLPRLVVLDDQPVQPVQPAAATKRSASPASQKRASSPAPVARGRPASPAPATKTTAGSGARPPSPRVGGARRAPSPAPPRAPSPAPAAAAPVASSSSSTAAPLRATPRGTPRGTPRSASPAGSHPSVSPAPSPASLGEQLPQMRTHTDPVTVSLTRELLHLNQQLIDTTNELTKSEAKRIEIGRLAQEQERRQEDAMARPMAVAAAPAPVGATEPTAPANPLAEMKSLMLGRAHRRRMSGGVAAGADSILSATAFLGGPAAAPPSFTAALPAASSSVDSSQSTALFSLSDAIDNIVARSQAPSPLVHPSASPTHVPQLDGQGAHQRQRSKSHLQLLSESPHFMPLDTSEQPQHEQPQQQQQQPQPHRHPSRPIRGLSPSRTKLEEHKAAMLSSSLGHVRSRTPVQPVATAAAPHAVVPVQSHLDEAGGGNASSSTHSQQHVEYGDADSNADSELAHWNEEDMVTSTSMSTSRPAGAVQTRSPSSPSTLAGPSTYAGGLSYAELAVQNMMLRKKGAALLARFHACQAACAQHESTIVEQRRATEVREGMDIVQRVLQSKARDSLARRMHQWHVHARGTSARRVHALALVLQRRTLTAAHRSSQNLSHAWDGWRSFVTHSNVAALKRRWIADWEGDLAQQARAHACALMDSTVRRSRAHARQLSLARAMSSLRCHARASTLRCTFDRERHKEAEEKQVLIALVLQHRTSLESEQKEHSEFRVASQIAAAETQAKIQRLEEKLAQNEALARMAVAERPTQPAPSSSQPSTRSGEMEKFVSTSRATVAMVDWVTRRTHRALRSALRRWSRTPAAASASAASSMASSEVATRDSTASDVHRGSSRSALHVADLHNSPAKPLPASSSSAAATHDLNVSHETMALFDPDHSPDHGATFVPLMPVPSVHQQQQQAQNQQHQQAQPLVHDIHHLTNHRGRHSPSSSGFSAPTFSSLSSSTSYVAPLTTRRFAPHGASSSTTPPPQHQRSSPGASSDHGRMDDVDQALRQAQETKRRLENETMEIARKIADARSRTSHYALQPHFHSQAQHSAAAAPLSPGHTRSATTHYGLPSASSFHPQAQHGHGHGNGGDPYLLHSRTRSHGSDLRTMAGYMDAPPPSASGHPPHRGVTAAPPPQVAGLRTRQPTRSPPRPTTSNGQMPGNDYYSTHVRRNPF